MIEILGIGLVGVVGASLYELAREEREDPRRPQPRRSLEERCPYCRGTFAEGGGAAEERVRCVGCGTWHHGECWEEHGRCSVHGCERRGAAGRRGRSRERRVGGELPGVGVPEKSSSASVTITDAPEWGPMARLSSQRAEEEGGSDSPLDARSAPSE